MRTFVSLIVLFIGLIVCTANVQAQQIVPGKTYSIKCAALYNDIEMFLSSRFNGTETNVQMNRVENQSAWQFVTAPGGYKMMSVRHSGYIFLDADGRFMITKDLNQAKVFALDRAQSGNFYLKMPDGTVLTHKSSTVLQLDGKRARDENTPEAEWVSRETIE